MSTESKQPQPADRAGQEAGLTHERARSLALAAGFSEAGLVALPYAAEERDAGRFREWVGEGRAGTMCYLERRAESGQLARERVAVPFPWARSALVCFASYNSGPPFSTHPAPSGSGWIARYAWTSRSDAKGGKRPSDYHKVLLKRLRAVEARLQEQFGEFESRAYVDTGPVVERSLAAAAGLGWVGKNTCLIHPKLGSFGFLAVLLTSLEVRESASQQVSESVGPAIDTPFSPNAGIEPRFQKGHGFSRADQSAKKLGALAPEGSFFLVPDRCGTCTRCIEACPTDALIAPYQMDATRCIAYLTIEHKGPIDNALMPGMGRQVFGCDICQDVCPWNRKELRNGPITVDPDLEPRAELINPELDWLASLDGPSLEREFNGSPVRRTGFLGLRRNVAIAMGNSGLARFVPQLESWATAADEALRAAALWALDRLTNG
jgi:epoxyqueuosine reductase